MANRAIKYRVHPTTEQSGKFPTVTPAKYKNDRVHRQKRISLHWGTTDG